MPDPTRSRLRSWSLLNRLGMLSTGMDVRICRRIPSLQVVLSTYSSMTELTIRSTSSSEFPAGTPNALLSAALNSLRRCKKHCCGVANPDSGTQLQHSCTREMADTMFRLSSVVW